MIAHLLFSLIALAVLLYVLMDGWDLGIGVLFLFAPLDAQRDEMMESVAPYWDGNETWLVFGGVTLFAAFPKVYATVLEVFYIPVMVMVTALVFRGISFEFRARSKSFKRLWNLAFGGGSIVAAFSQGIILGKLVQGIETQAPSYGTTFTIGLFPLACGLAMLAGYSLLGSAWIILKTDGATQIFGREISRAALIVTLGMFAVVCVWTPLSVPRVYARWFEVHRLVWFGGLAIFLLALALTFWRSIWDTGNDRLPLRIAILMTLLAFAGFGTTVWPYILPYSLTIADAAADPVSLRFASVGIILVLPLVLAFQGFAYRVFRGKMQVGKGSYGASGVSQRLRTVRNTQEDHLS